MRGHYDNFVERSDKRRFISSIIFSPSCSSCGDTKPMKKKKIKQNKLYHPRPEDIIDGNRLFTRKYLCALGDESRKTRK